MKQIASVPSREVLLSKLLGSLQSPITNLARVLNQIAEKGGAADAAVEAAPAEKQQLQKNQQRHRQSNLSGGWMKQYMGTAGETDRCDNKL